MTHKFIKKEITSEQYYCDYCGKESEVTGNLYVVPDENNELDFCKDCISILLENKLKIWKILDEGYK